MYPQQHPTITGSLSLCDHHLVNGVLNMATIPLLVGSKDPQAVNSTTDTDGNQHQEPYQRSTLDPAHFPRLCHGIPRIIISPTSESSLTEEALYLDDSRPGSQAMDLGDLVLDLRQFKCSSELLESVESFLS